MTFASEFSFTVADQIFTAVLWNKVEGKERYYIKNASGKDYAVFYINEGAGRIMESKKAWASQDFRNEFTATFIAAWDEAGRDAEAVSPIALDIMGIETPAEVAVNEIVAEVAPVAKSNTEVRTVKMTETAVAQLRDALAMTADTFKDNSVVSGILRNHENPDFYLNYLRENKVDSIIRNATVNTDACTIDVKVNVEMRAIYNEDCDNYMSRPVKFFSVASAN